MSSCQGGRGGEIGENTTTHPTLYLSNRARQEGKYLWRNISRKLCVEEYPTESHSSRGFQGEQPELHVVLEIFNSTDTDESLVV